MKNLKTNGFMEMSENEMYSINGGDALVRVKGLFKLIGGFYWWQWTIPITNGCKFLSELGIIPKDDYVGISTGLLKEGWNNLIMGN